MKSVVCVGRNDLKIISVKDSLLPARKPNHHLVRGEEFRKENGIKRSESEEGDGGYE